MLATTVKAYLAGPGKASAWQPRKPHGHFLPRQLHGQSCLWLMGDFSH